MSFQQFTVSSTGVVSISGNHFLCSSIKSNSLSIQVLIGDCSNLVTLSGCTSNSGSLAIYTTSAVTSSTEVLTPQSHPWALESTFFTLLLVLIVWPLPLNHECSQWHLGWWILSKRFSIDFAQIHRGLNHIWQLKPYNIHSLKNETWKSKLLFDPGTSMSILLAGMMTTLISLSISIRALGKPGTLSMSSSILKGIFSF